MDAGVFVLGGVFALAALLMVWNGSRRRAIRQHLEQQGFVPCEEETEGIRQAFAAVAGGHGVTPRRSRWRTATRSPAVAAWRIDSP
jgi:hypothetical protein